MKYFLDCEFIEDGKTIDLISIGLVSEDGQEFYAVNRECDFRQASDWVVDNVLKPIGLERGGLCCINPSDPGTPPKALETLKLAKTKQEIVHEMLIFLYSECLPHFYLSTDELIAEYIPPKKRPEFWGEWCSYDWVAFCQLFGTMMDLPKGLPMRCNDIIQYAEMFGLTSSDLPESLETEGNHNALLGAKTVKMRYEFIKKLHLGH